LAKFLYSAAMSADGFIAGPGGDDPYQGGEGEAIDTSTCSHTSAVTNLWYRVLSE
jgi:hypothetical protein